MLPSCAILTCQTSFGFVYVIQLSAVCFSYGFVMYSDACFSITSLSACGIDVCSQCIRMGHRHHTNILFTGIFCITELAVIDLVSNWYWYCLFLLENTGERFTSYVLCAEFSVVVHQSCIMQLHMNSTVQKFYGDWIESRQDFLLLCSMQHATHYGPNRNL